MLAVPQGAPTSPAPGPALAELLDAIGAEATAQAIRLFRDSATAGVPRALHAVAQRSLADAGREAHALKSAAALLGATELAQTLGALEHAAFGGNRAAAQAAAARLPTLLDDALAQFDAALTRPD
ncbi:Hpt domain-containing protein [Falsiroseomonas oryzae]|uniref:Hpt domain-containing protein n=1 Tax=Falsiroseomonas oryzae TaxID=2766473 RepID=UPI0022EB4EBE|nr:Hpt domain-containing protein [Roseomonas sp. MO-31]